MGSLTNISKLSTRVSNATINDTSQGKDSDQENRISKTKKKDETLDYNEESYSDDEKEERIIQWLLGVQVLAEPPPIMPDLDHPEPQQTDTAIHVVYDGDK